MILSHNLIMLRLNICNSIIIFVLSDFYAALLVFVFQLFIASILSLISFYFYKPVQNEQAMGRLEELTKKHDL